MQAYRAFESSSQRFDGYLVTNGTCLILGRQLIYHYMVEVETKADPWPHA